MSHRVVSQTYLELFKIFSRNLYFAEIVLLMRIACGNSVRVPKGRLWAQVQRVWLEIFTLNVIFVTVYFHEIILESSGNVREQPQEPMQTSSRQGWGLLSQFPPFRYFLNFSALSKVIFKHTLVIE